MSGYQRIVISVTAILIAIRLHPRASLRVLPLAVRQRRRQEGRPVLHPAMRGAPAGRDARPIQGRVYDPCCGWGGMFVISEKSIEAHSGKIGDISIYGQESNYTTWPR